MLIFYFASHVPRLFLFVASGKPSPIRAELCQSDCLQLHVQQIQTEHAQCLSFPLPTSRLASGWIRYRHGDEKRKIYFWRRKVTVHVGRESVQPSYDNVRTFELIADEPTLRNYFAVSLLKWAYKCRIGMVKCWHFNSMANWLLAILPLSCVHTGREMSGHKKTWSAHEFSFQKCYFS